MARTATKTGSARKSLSDYITERFDEFSRSQKDVARYIVDHLDEAAFQTAEELARRAATSSSTVDRFSQALKEIIGARIWSGIHFRTADVQGAVLGKKVAHQLKKHYFQPLD